MKAITFFFFFSLIFITAIFLKSCSSNKQTVSSFHMSYDQFKGTQKSFSSKDGDIKFIDKGEGDVILLLHGIPTSSWLYRKMIDEIANEGFRVIAPDMLGFGNSDSPEGYDIYSPREHANRLIALMTHLKIDSWTHVTHDAGGLWTWELLDQHPEKVNKLVLLNTLVLEEGFHPPIRMKHGPFAQFSMWLYDNGSTTNAMLSALFKKGLKKENALSEEDREGYRTPLTQKKTHAMYAFFTKTCEKFYDYSPVMEKFQKPVTVIWGEHDEMLQWAPQAEKAKEILGIKNEDVHIIDAKHFIQEEKPKEVSAFITAFAKK